MRSKRLTSRNRQEKDSKIARISIAILATVGIIDTGSITLSKWGLISSLSCPGDSGGCDQVLNSPWGTIFENGNLIIPLSFVGLISYSIILLITLLPLIPNIKLEKKDIIPKTWWALFTLSLTMTVFSLILIWIMIYKIEAFCFFCILSGTISILILLLSIIGGSWDNPGQLFFRGILLSLSILLSSLIWSSNVDPVLTTSNSTLNGSPPQVRSISNPSTMKLAKHLTSKNIIMYSAYWCPHCHDQKELFGKEASKELKIVECAKDGLNNQSDLCDIKGINSYPSWEINGEIEAGVKSLEELAKISNF